MSPSFGMLVAVSAIAAVVVAAATTGPGQAFTFAGGAGPQAWNTLYSGCAASTRQQSPIRIPTASFFPSESIQVVLASTVAVGTPLLAPFHLQSDGGLAMIELAFSGITAVVNKTTYRASHIIIRRPAEHAPDAATLAKYGIALSDVAEQQTFWAIGNTTRLIVSRFVYVSSSSSETISSFPALESLITAVRTGSDLASFRSLSSNLGFASTNYYSYFGSTTTPSCDAVQWLVDPSLNRVASIAGLPLGTARPIQTLNPSLANGKVVAISIAAPAANSAALNTSSPLRAWNISLDFGSSGSAVTSLSRYVMYQTMVGMLASMTGLLLLFIAMLFIVKLTYRSPARSVWTHPKYGLQRFGFGNSALLHDLQGESDEEETETGEGGSANEGDEDDDDA